MESFRTEIENPVVDKDIIDLEQKIFAFNNNKIDDILNKLYIYRLQIKGDFEQKVEAMNKVTENLIKEHD